MENWTKKHEDEILSDNSRRYEQCRNCAYRIRRVVRGKEVGYDLPYCEAYPEHKPKCVEEFWTDELCPRYKRESEE